MVQLLLDSGAGNNVNLKDSVGDTAIMYAAYGKGAGNRYKYGNELRVSINLNTFFNFFSQKIARKSS